MIGFMEYRTSFIGLQFVTNVTGTWEEASKVDTGNRRGPDVCWMAYLLCPIKGFHQRCIFLIGFIYIREYQITSHFHDYDRLIEELNHNFHVEADLNLRFTLC